MRERETRRLSVNREEGIEEEEEQSNRGEGQGEGEGVREAKE